MIPVYPVCLTCLHAVQQKEEEGEKEKEEVGLVVKNRRET